MKVKLGITTIMIVFLFAWTICPAQTAQTVSFAYDLNGNRTERLIVIGGSKDGANDSKGLATAHVEDFETLSVTLYPNPTDGQLCVTINKDAEDDAKLLAILKSPKGDVIYYKVFNYQTEYFDLTCHPSGIYLLELIVGNKNRVWKVIKK